MQERHLYRADIDGLRAVSIAAVVLFHAFPRLLPGGFTGVDVFFVISGFLITSILVEGSGQRGALVEFYVRRVRRIFPALLMVLACTLAAAWIVMFPDELRQAGKHVLAGSLFLSNFALLRESGYFDAASETKPLLHLWSLAVEEQFYVLWPALLSLGLHRPRRWLAITLAVLLVSFAANLLFVAERPQLAFYSPLSRFWQLMVGGALALAPRIQEVAGNRARSAYSAAGIAMILYGFLISTATSPYPGYLALLPTIGAALIVASGPGAWVNERILSHHSMVYLGRISYPLYLWHWSLLSLASLATIGTLTTPARGAIIGASILLASATHHLIERPARRLRVRGVLAMAGAMGAMAVLGAFVYLGRGFPGRFTQDQQMVLDRYDNELPQWRYFEREHIRDRYRDDCNFYDVDAFREGRTTQAARPAISVSCYARLAGRKAVFLWGDSHAQQLNPGLTDTLSPAWQVLQVASSGCEPALPVMPSGGDYCAHSNRFALAQIEASRPEVVILAQDGRRDLLRMRELALRLRDLGVGTVIAAGPVPHWRPVLFKILARWRSGPFPERTWVGLETAVIEENNEFKKSVARDEPFQYADIISALCDSGGCLTYIGNDPIAGLTTFDYGHLTIGASRYVARTSLSPLIDGRDLQKTSK